MTVSASRTFSFAACGGSIIINSTFYILNSTNELEE